MDYTYIITHRHQSALTRLPEISQRKTMIRATLNSRIQPAKPVQASTPDPYLTIKMMKIHDRPHPIQSISNSFDEFNHYTNSTLSKLIKNGAVTFISPNDFINQIHQESLSASPTVTASIKPNIKASSIKKMEKLGRSSFYEAMPTSCYKVFQVNSNPSMPSKYFNEKIEITGCQVPKIIRKKQKYESEDDEPRPITVSNSFSLSKEISLRKSQRPVIIPNKNQKYFKPLKYEPDSTKAYFHPNNY